MIYQLELCKRIGDEWDHTSDERLIAESNDLQELKERAESIQLKGNKYRREELRIIELDEFGDIVDYIFFDRHNSRRIE